MEIIKNENNGVVTLSLSGRLDSATSPQLEGMLNNIIPLANEIVLDFKDLDFVSSAGLRVLLTAQKSVNARKTLMKIIHVNDVIGSVFELTGFNSILTIEK